MSYFPRAVLLLILFSLLYCCTGSEKRKPPETVSDPLNKLIRSAPYQYINLDEAEVHEINLTEENIIYSVFQKHPEDEPLLGRIREYTLVNDRFYIFDSSAEAIFEISIPGDVRGPLTQTGRGPGEHSGWGILTSNAKYIYYTDANSARINRYTYEMTSVDPIKKFQFSRSFDLNNKIILTQNRNSSGFHPVEPEEGLISISSINDLTHTLATIMLRIIPGGYQPQVYNRTQFSVNGRNKIAASYGPLPLFFLFDEDFSHTQTLILEYSIFEEMDIPAMVFFKPKGNKGFGGSIPITQYNCWTMGIFFYPFVKN